MQRIVFGTLRHRWLRTVLVWLSTLIAVMLLGFFLAIRHGFAVGPVQVGADLVLLESVDRTSGLPIGLMSTVTVFPGVRTAVAITGTSMRFGADPHPVGVEALSANAFLDVSGIVGSGALPSAQARAWLADPIGALVSAGAARKNGWRVGETLVVHGMPGASPQDLTFNVDRTIAIYNRWPG